MKIVTGCFYVLFTVYVYDNDFMGTNSIKVKVPIQSNKGKPSVTMIKCVTLTHNIIKDKECPNSNVKLALFTSLFNLFFTRTHQTQRLSDWASPTCIVKKIEESSVLSFAHASAQ